MEGEASGSGRGSEGSVASYGGREGHSRPPPVRRAPVARLSPACRLPRARRPPVARPSSARLSPVARLSRARRPPVARPSPACRAPVARLSPACRAFRAPVARLSRARRPPVARQGPDRCQTFNIIIIILKYTNWLQRSLCNRLCEALQSNRLNYWIFGS